MRLVVAEGGHCCKHCDQVLDTILVRVNRILEDGSFYDHDGN